MKELTASQLREFLLYEPTTGYFRYTKMRAGVQGEVGDIAGCVRADGRCLIRIGGRLYYASKLAWLYVHGRWPEDELDHINGDRSDDRIDNLREVTRHQNMANVGLTRANKTGFRGVVQIAPGRWRATFRRHHLGVFDTPEEAASAYAAVAKAKYGEFVRKDERVKDIDQVSFEQRRMLGLIRLREKRRCTGSGSVR